MDVDVGGWGIAGVVVLARRICRGLLGLGRVEVGRSVVVMVVDRVGAVKKRRWMGVNDVVGAEEGGALLHGVRRSLGWWIFRPASAERRVMVWEGSIFFFFRA